MKKRIIYSFLVLSLITTACVKHNLFDSLPNAPEEPQTPEKPDESAKVVVNIDWQETLNKEEIEAFTLFIGKEMININKQEQPDTLLCDPGDYEIYLYNIPSGIIISDALANIKIDEDDYLIPNAESFYFAKKSITAEINTVSKVDIKPISRMRKLEIVLKTPDTLFTSFNITGFIENVAGSYDLNMDKEINSGSVGLTFINDSCTANLFGIINGNQKLTLNAFFDNDTTRNTTIDISSYLMDFNSNKTELKKITIDKLELDPLFLGIH